MSYQMIYILEIRMKAIKLWRRNKVRWMKLVLLVWMFCTLVLNASFSQEFPEQSNRLVNDYVGALSAGQIAQLERSEERRVGRECTESKILYDGKKKKV